MNPPNPVTTKQAERLIDFLTDKTLSFGCKVVTNESTFILLEGFDNPSIHALYADKTLYNTVGINKKEITKIIGHDILIGDVLKKMKGYSGDDFGETPSVVKLLGLWQPLGLDRSLQDITKKEIPPGGNELLQFLASIFLTP